MRAVDRFSTLKKIFATSAKVLLAGAALTGVVKLIILDESVKAESRKLEDAALMQEDGVTYEIISENAVAMQIYILMKVPGENNDKDFHDAYIFDMDDKTIIQGKTEEDSVARPSILSFENFDNPRVIERVTTNACAIAANIAAFPETGRHQKERRAALQDMTGKFAALHCPK